MYPFTPTYNAYFTAYARDAHRKVRVIYLFMSHVTNRGMRRQILVTILHAVLELLHAWEWRRNLTRFLGLNNAPKHESDFGPVFLHVTIFLRK